MLTFTIIKLHSYCIKVGNVRKAGNQVETQEST